jgi:hypothetical protein
VPVVAFCGVSEVEDGGPLHLNAIRAIAPAGMPSDEAMARGMDLLKEAAADYFKQPDR